MSTNFSLFDCDLLVIHTNFYAGNFERQMAAFITGEVGECEVGKEYFNSDYDYSMFKGIVKHIPDDHFVFRPVTIYPNPAYRNNGLGYHYRLDDPDGLLTALKKYKEYRLRDHIKQIEDYSKVINDYEKNGEDGSHFKNYKRAGWDISSLRDAIKNLNIKNEEINKMTVDDIESFDAYQSVAISFYKNTINDDIINVIKERSMEFINLFNKPHFSNFRSREKYSNLSIEGFELIKLRISEEKIKI